MQLDLNGHYCLATKAHYEKLVEGGAIEDDNFTMEFHLERGYLSVALNGFICSYKRPPSLKPMHLHNNEWVFGSLEHEECKHKNTRPYNVFGAVVCNNCGYVHQRKPKPVERITREKLSHEIHTLLGKYIPITNNQDEATDIAMSIFNEYLEANQKESK